MTVRIAAPYYNDPDYIDALVASASDHLKRDYDNLLFSFHGIPERHLRKTNPSCGHCLRVENCWQRSEPGARHVLSSPMLQERGGIREEGGA